MQENTNNGSQNNDDLVVRFGSVIIRSTGLCIFTLVPLSVISSFVPSGEEGYGDYIAKWYIWSGLITVFIEMVIGFYLWKNAKSVSKWMCRGL